MEEKPPDAVEPRPTLSVTLPAAPSMKRAGGAAALLHGLHLLLCVSAPVRSNNRVMMFYTPARATFSLLLIKESQT